VDDLGLRLLLLARFLAFLAIVYLLLDLLAARLFTKPGSKVRGFFALVASPLTRPVRSFLPEDATEGQVRGTALGVVVLVWAVLALVLRSLAPRG